MFDLANFSVSDMVVCSTELRRVTAGSATMQDAARTVVRQLCASFRDPRTGAPQLTAQLLLTVPWARLTPQLRADTMLRHPELLPGSELSCLTLLAADGHQQVGYVETDPVLPLSHPAALRNRPVLATVLDRLGAMPPGAVGDRPEHHQVHVVPDVSELPDRAFVRAHQVRSVLGYAGVLSRGMVFTVLLFSRVALGSVPDDLFRPLAVSTRLALLPLHTAPLFSGEPAQGRAGGSRLAEARVDALEELLAVQEDAAVEQARTAQSYLGMVRSQKEQLRIEQDRLKHEKRIVETLYGVGQQLTRELDLERLVQTTIEAATSVIAAEHGAFRYSDRDPNGLPETRYALTGDPTQTGLLLRGAPDNGRVVMRRGDLTTGIPAQRGGGTPRPPRSFLAVPVTSRTGEHLGDFTFFHTEPNIFTERDEQLALGIAAQAATAIENARLYRSVHETAFELQRSLLPSTPPDVEELDIAFRYLPGARGSQVGGDWFDVIPLPAGRVALVIGDVMGRGLKAAAVMGQLRTAVRAYAVMDLPPAQVMHHLNRLVTGMGAEDRITTCVYAVFDPAGDTVRWSNAGHLPPAHVTASGEVRLLDDDLGMPLGVDGAAFSDRQISFTRGERLLLYTDGLVECHDESLTDRLGKLTLHVDGGAGSGAVDATCDGLIEAMLTGDEHDDVALLLVGARDAVERAVCLELPPTARASGEARAFVRRNLLVWGLPRHTDTACSVVTELVSNAAQHARTPMELRLRHRPGRLVVQVADHDGRPPKEVPTLPQDLEERHRGLRIVAALTRDWGVRPTDTGKIVWAEIDDR